MKHLISKGTSKMLMPAYNIVIIINTYFQLLTKIYYLLLAPLPHFMQPFVKIPHHDFLIIKLLRF